MVCLEPKLSSPRARWPSLIQNTVLIHYTPTFVGKGNTQGGTAAGLFVPQPPWLAHVEAILWYKALLWLESGGQRVGEGPQRVAPWLGSPPALAPASVGLGNTHWAPGPWWGGAVVQGTLMTRGWVHRGALVGQCHCLLPPWHSLGTLGLGLCSHSLVPRAHPAGPILLFRHVWLGQWLSHLLVHGQSPFNPCPPWVCF